MRFASLQCKDVINVIDGCKIGYVNDVEIDLCTYQMVALVVERINVFRLFCFFRDADCLVIPFEQVVSIGEDVILVNVCI